jgi:hypothetical protein
MSGAGVAMD